MNDTTKKIAALNDAFCKSMHCGQVVHRQSISALLPEDQTKIIGKVRLFYDFSEANGLYGEHDFGAIDHERQKVFFK